MQKCRMTKIIENELATWSWLPSGDTGRKFLRRVGHVDDLERFLIRFICSTGQQRYGLIRLCGPIVIGAVG